MNSSRAARAGRSARQSIFLTLPWDAVLRVASHATAQLPKVRHTRNTPSQSTLGSQDPIGISIIDEEITTENSDFL